MKKILLLAFGLCIAFQIQAQFLTEPEASQAVELKQKIGITDVKITYASPAVKGRQIWDGLIPYGKVWRAGANENTTISFSHEVSIGGQKLPAGTYGLHMIPTATDWTLIFSSNHTSWGSYSYTETEDVLRVKVSPKENPMTEWLTFVAIDKGADFVEMGLAWDKLLVPFRIEMDVHKIVLDNFRKELRGSVGFGWESWNQAAQYCLNNKIELEQGLDWVNFSISGQFSSIPTYDNLMTKAQILEALGREAESKRTIQQAINNPTASVNNLYGYGRQLIGQKDAKGALDLYKKLKSKHPNHWLSDHGLARVYSSIGKFDLAVKHETIALKGAPENSKPTLEGYLEKLEKKVDIN